VRLTNSKIFLAASCVALSALVAASPTEARIQCKGNFQVTKYGLIAAPYCEEQQIAAVARSYGVRVTDEEVRRDPLTKVKLCYRFGSDVRLKGSCGAYAPEQYR
jgi:hypothetical protein